MKTRGLNGSLSCIRCLLVLTVSSCVLLLGIAAWCPGRPGSARAAGLLRLVPQQLGSFQELQVAPSVLTADDWTAMALPARTFRRVLLHDWVRPGPPTVEGGNGTREPRYLDLETAWSIQRQVLHAHLQRLEEQQQQHHQEDQPSSSSFWADDDLHFETTSLHDSDLAPIFHVGKDAVFFLEHQPVFTLGTGSDESFILPAASPPQLNDNMTEFPASGRSSSLKNTTTPASIPVVRIDRGGEVTYHGPGQLTVYLVLDLRSYRQDIHWYVRALEEVVLRALMRAGLTSEAGLRRDPDYTGVWLGSAKVAAVGVKCRRWITQHGLALNVLPSSLPAFDRIVPCGITDRSVTCVQDHLDRPITLAEMALHVQGALQEVLQIQLVEWGRESR